MMKRSIILIFVSFLMFSGLIAQEKNENPRSIVEGEYFAVIEGYDWWPAVSKVVLILNEEVTSVNKYDFKVTIKKTSEIGELAEESATGERYIVYAYVSDKEGNIIEKGDCITLVLQVGPDLPIGSPMYYFYNDTLQGNVWVDYNMTITNTKSGDVWTHEVGKIRPLVDKFDISGTFEYDDITLTYAEFVPVTNNEKYPLIIWLHGGGEGGTDPSIPLMANRAANYASDEIQLYFDGAYVLVPQCPGAWMHNEEGVMTAGREDDIYHEALMALIKNYVSEHPDIDRDRIYVGGCSNGGYMSLKLILMDPDYFAAGFISALAYMSQYITNEQIESIKDVPMWFVHSADDKTTPPDITVLPVYDRLIKAGAKNVHFSYYDHVTDITGFFGGENYRYYGHFSWIYVHANKCVLDYDGKPVIIDGRPATIMEWMAAMKRD